MSNEEQWVPIIPLDDQHAVLNTMPLNCGAYYVQGDVLRVEPLADGTGHTVTIANVHPYQYETFAVIPDAAASGELALLARVARVEGVEMYLHGDFLKVRMPRTSAFAIEEALRMIGVLAPKRRPLDFPPIPERCSVSEAQALFARAAEGFLREASAAANGMAITIAGQFGKAGSSLRDMAAYLATLDDQGRDVREIELPEDQRALAKVGAEHMWKCNQRVKSAVIRAYYELVCRLGGVEPVDSGEVLSQ